jgi:hypothetical protein
LMKSKARQRKAREKIFFRYLKPPPTISTPGSWFPQIMACWGWG